MRSALQILKIYLSAKVENLRAFSLSHNFLSSTSGTTDLLYGFDSSEARREQEVTNSNEELAKGFFLRQNTLDRYL